MEINNLALATGKSQVGIKIARVVAPCQDETHGAGGAELGGHAQGDTTAALAGADRQLHGDADETTLVHVGTVLARANVDGKVTARVRPGVADDATSGVLELDEGVVHVAIVDVVDDRAHHGALGTTTDDTDAVDHAVHVPDVVHVPDAGVAAQVVVTASQTAQLSAHAVHPETVGAGETHVNAADDTGATVPATVATRTTVATATAGATVATVTAGTTMTAEAWAAVPAVAATTATSAAGTTGAGATGLAVLAVLTSLAGLPVLAVPAIVTVGTTLAERPRTALSTPEPGRTATTTATSRTPGTGGTPLALATRVTLGTPGAPGTPATLLSSKTTRTTATPPAIEAVGTGAATLAFHTPSTAGTTKSAEAPRTTLALLASATPETARTALADRAALAGQACAATTTLGTRFPPVASSANQTCSTPRSGPPRPAWGSSFPRPPISAWCTPCTSVASISTIPRTTLSARSARKSLRANGTLRAPLAADQLRLPDTFQKTAVATTKSADQSIQFFRLHLVLELHTLNVALDF
mmetsp:Transcript_14829/g.34819  ORF Transcript_14829/g.34819 Transcript_14829/m.34819 type:complete len:530 (-) Transcript_14829:478-2067(-)